MCVCVFTVIFYMFCGTEYIFIISDNREVIWWHSSAVFYIFGILSELGIHCTVLACMASSLLEA